MLPQGFTYHHGLLSLVTKVSVARAVARDTVLCVCACVCACVDKIYSLYFKLGFVVYYSRAPYVMPFTGDFLHRMNLYTVGSFILGVNIIFSTVHVFVRDRSVPIPVKGLCIIMPTIRGRGGGSY